MFMLFVLACHSDIKADQEKSISAARAFAQTHAPKAEVVALSCAEGDSDGNGLVRCTVTVATYCYTVSYSVECPASNVLSNYTTTCQFADGSGLVLPACEDNACPDRE